MLYDTVRTAVMGGDEDVYDVIISPVYFNSTMIGEGLMTDISVMPYVDLQKPYWFDGFNTTATIGGKTYMAASDGTLDYIATLFCMPFNEDMAVDYQLPDLYDIVDEGKWTLDVLREIVSGLYVDLNGNGEADTDDQFGMEIINGNYVYTHLTSSEGGAITEIDGKYVYTYGNEHSVDLFDAVYRLLYESNNGVMIYKNQLDRTGKVFLDGHSLFTGMMMYEADALRDLSFDYGMFPYPKYDETQQEYHTCTGNSATVFMVPITNTGNEKVGAVLEALSSEAHVSTTEAYYEDVLQGKYSTSEDMVRMICMLRETETMIFGDVYASVLDGIHDKFKGGLDGNGHAGAGGRGVSGRVLRRRAVGLSSCIVPSGMDWPG